MVLEFTLEIDGEDNETTEDYQNFIRRLQIRLGVRFSHNVRALPVQENPPTRFFNVIIRTSNRSVRFRLQMDNLYLIGYRQMEPEQWLEFNNNIHRHLITEQGTRFLGFGGCYGELCGAANRTLQQTSLGLVHLESAVDQLANETGRELRARSLIVVIMMICESTRFIPVSQYIAEHSDFQIPPWMINLVHSWGDLSGALLQADAYPEQSFMLRQNNIVLPNGGVMRTLEDARQILGILLGLFFLPYGIRRSRRALQEHDEGQCFLGLPLVQVFTVCINNIDNEDPGDLYGTITISNGLYTEYIYDRKNDNPKSIRLGQDALLTGPSYTLTAFGNITIKLLLTDHDTWPNPDDLIMDQDITWDAFDIGRVYDRLISKTLNSDRGSVTVNYAVLRNAVAANVIVSLKEGGENEVEVYGKVYAHYGNWENHPETTCLLFDRTSNDYIEVWRGQNIPLLRSAIAVPMTDSLQVTANLYDYDWPDGDDLIANGTVEFQVPENIPDTSSQAIHGEDGNWVQVTVEWSSGN